MNNRINKEQELDTLEWNMKVKNENSLGNILPTNCI